MERIKVKLKWAGGLIRDYLLPDCRFMSTQAS